MMSIIPFILIKHALNTLTYVGMWIKSASYLNINVPIVKSKLIAVIFYRTSTI
jgi:hypothetical protein